MRGVAHLGAKSMVPTLCKPIRDLLDVFVFEFGFSVEGPAAIHEVRQFVVARDVGQLIAELAFVVRPPVFDGFEDGRPVAARGAVELPMLFTVEALHGPANAVPSLAKNLAGDGFDCAIACQEQTPSTHRSPSWSWRPCAAG